MCSFISENRLLFEITLSDVKNILATVCWLILYFWEKHCSLKNNPCQVWGFVSRFFNNCCFKTSVLPAVLEMNQIYGGRAKSLCCQYEVSGFSHRLCLQRKQSSIYFKYIPRLNSEKILIQSTMEVLYLIWALKWLIYTLFRLKSLHFRG